MSQAMDIVRNMGVGLNLGDSFDSFTISETLTSGECGWGNPRITKEMIDTIAKAGFGTVRVPITWFEHVSNAPDYTIDTEWMARIKEVLQYILDAGMYAIIDMHHENSWLMPKDFCYEVIKEKYVKIWSQIAEELKDWDEHLIFQGMNEPQVKGGENEFYGGTPAVQQFVNDLERDFIEVVRRTGSHNANRLLLIPTVGASSAETAVTALRIPEDPMIAVSIHPYVPALFCFDHGNPQNQAYWTEEGSQILAEVFERFDRVFIKKGIPVVITECGAQNKRLPGTSQDNEEEAIRWFKEYKGHASRLGIPCILWDNNRSGVEDEAFGLFNRNDLSWHRPRLKDEIVSKESIGIEKE